VKVEELREKDRHRKLSARLALKKGCTDHGKKDQYAPGKRGILGNAEVAERFFPLEEERTSSSEKGEGTRGGEKTVWERVKTRKNLLSNLEKAEHAKEIIRRRNRK